MIAEVSKEEADKVGKGIASLPNRNRKKRNVPNG
jgi:hypothetical protein